MTEHLVEMVPGSTMSQQNKALRSHQKVQDDILH